VTESGGRDAEQGGMDCARGQDSLGNDLRARSLHNALIAGGGDQRRPAQTMVGLLGDLVEQIGKSSAK